MKVENRNQAWISAIVFVILAILGVVLRSFFITSITEFPMIVDNALIIEQSGAKYSLLSLEEIYTSLFTFFFTFVGNKASLAIYLQIILQVLSIMILFYAVKNLANRATAWATYVVCIFTPFVFSITVDQFYFMIFSIVLCVFAFYIHIIAKEERSITLKWMFSFLIALILTRTILLDSIFLTFITIGLLIAILYTDAIEKKVKTKIACGISYLLGSFFSMLSYFAIDYFLFEENMLDQAKIFVQELFTQIEEPLTGIYEYIKHTGLNEIVIYTILGFLLLLFVFSFFKKDKKASIVFTVLLFMTFIYQFFLETSINPYIVSAYIVLVLIILGIQGIITPISNREKQVDICDSTEINEEVNEERETEVDSDKQEVSDKEDCIEVKDEVNHQEQIEIIEEKNLELKEQNDIMKKELQKVKFIENPLPLPKKHVPKTLDYRFEPKPEDMHYDV